MINPQPEVTHKQKQTLVLIRQWQLEVCKGDECAAAMLNFFEYWHKIKVKHIEEKILKKKDFIPTLKDLLQWHNIPKLQEGLLNIYGDKRIRKAVKLLTNLNFISIHRNPDPRFKFDNTRFFLFNVDAVNKYLEDGSLDMPNGQHDLAKIPGPSGKITEGLNKNSCTVIPFGKHSDCQEDITDIPDEQQQYTKTTYKDYVHRLHSENTQREPFDQFWTEWVRLTQIDQNKNQAREIIINNKKFKNEEYLRNMINGLQLEALERRVRIDSKINTSNWPSPDKWLRSEKWIVSDNLNIHDEDNKDYHKNINKME